MVGSVVLGVWKSGPKSKVAGMLGFTVVSGAFICLFGVLPVGWLLAVACFGMMSVIPFISAYDQVIWQRKVTPGLQGRVLALNNMISKAPAPFVMAATGPLIDRVLGPALMTGGALAGTVGPIVGVGPGRGVAFLFLCMGVAMILVGLVPFFFRSVRNLETELPDMLPDVAPAAAEEPSAASLAG
jgi:hypothetical protein